jgi:simple sugar transport system ATP-binding protein
MRAPAASNATGDHALALTDITKNFGTTRALDAVTMRVRRGTVHALLGENGAGKTTLMRIAFGLIQPDAGLIAYGGPPARFTTTPRAIAAGIGMVHQHFMNVPAMTVAENVALGSHGRFRSNIAAQRVRDIGETTGLRLDPDALVAELPVGAQQRLEIVKALSKHATTLILDEPTAVLAPTEAAELLRWIRTFADAGNAVVLITHKLTDAIAVSDEATVLRHGRVTLHAPRSQLSVAVLTDALLGGASTEQQRAQTPRRTGSANAVALLRNVSVRDERDAIALRNATLEVLGGEILGVAAVEGSGQHQLLRILAGRAAATEGSVQRPNTVAFIPEDRHRDALILDFNLAENVALTGAGKRRGRFSPTAFRNLTRGLLPTYDVRGGSPNGTARALSGGNQQKLVLARELSEKPALVIAENPTRGLDIRATQDVLARLRDAANQGAAVVVYSADIDELLAISDRIIALHAGVIRECPVDREAVGRAMLGVA